MDEEFVPTERINWRKHIESLTPAKAKEWQIEEYRKCSEPGIDPKYGKVYWFNNYVSTIDTRRTPSIIPFQLYPYQIDKLLKTLDTYCDTFIEKSRDMGISWTVMGWELWNCLYTKGFTALNISRKESEVQDTGNSFHSLHGRLLFMYQRLPPFLKPRLHNPFLTFSIPTMNSIIKGESSNPKAGRDSQYKFILIDEAAHIECLDEMWKGCRNASNTICLNSTPPANMVNNKYAEIGEMKQSGFVKLKFHWKEHPLKTDEWFKKKTAAMTPAEIAQELEIRYDAALTRRSYPEYDDNIHMLSHKVYLNNQRPLYCFMDFGLAGEVFLFAQKDAYDRIFFLYYKIFFNKLTKELIPELVKCLAHLGYAGELKNVKFIGDKSGDKRSRTTKTSVIDEYRTLSNGQIDIKYKELSNDEKMKCVKECLKQRVQVQGVWKPQFNVSQEPTCIKLSDCFKMLQLNKMGLDHLDNKFTHAVNAAEYGINFLFPRKKETPAVACSEPGQRTEENKRGEPIIITTPRDKIQSAAAVVGHNRIERKGAMLR